MRKLVTGAATALLLFAVRFGWNMINVDEATTPSPDDAKAWAAETDSWVSEDLASGATAPARDWLSQSGNALFEGDPQAVQGLIDALYAAGSPNVFFTGIEKFGGTNVSASIAVELTEDPAVRERILHAEAEFWQDPESATEDVGQKYVVISFD